MGAPSGGGTRTALPASLMLRPTTGEPSGTSRPRKKSAPCSSAKPDNSWEPPRRKARPICRRGWHGRHVRSGD